MPGGWFSDEAFSHPKTSILDINACRGAFASHFHPGAAAPCECCDSHRGPGNVGSSNVGWTRGTFRRCWGNNRWGTEGWAPENCIVDMTDMTGQFFTQWISSRSSNARLIWDRSFISTKHTHAHYLDSSVFNRFLPPIHNEFWLQKKQSKAFFLFVFDTLAKKANKFQWIFDRNPCFFRDLKGRGFVLAKNCPTPQVTALGSTDVFFEQPKVLKIDPLEAGRYIHSGKLTQQWNMNPLKMYISYWT